ncbi:polyhydroxybutyrate depolymerase [Curtobacterium flaccumfaciens]|uniref:Polyhydroxybutyrate depolymerase n=1 Tax=Curtobacterium salicis TaxID=1779862 RepID=A0ABX0TD50_9MICO|nr:PHB depolymerase family esterase [Curtobacterium sp. WW7]NII41794.1 polyhydroxybutyrate depolymerase [Curtobacterium sp. WW7]
MRTNLSVAGRPRSFTVVGDPDGPEERPLVLVFHGSKQNGEAHRRFTGGTLDQLALDGRAVVVYLDGYRGNWNDARAASSFPARKERVDDVAFARAVVDSVSGTHRFDARAVVGVGYSNGGQMVFRLLHEMPELLAGAVVVAATMPDREGFLAVFSETSERPLPFVLVAGTADRIVPFEGGRMAWWARAVFKVGGVTLSAPATADYFARRNGITTEPSVSLLPVRHGGTNATRMERTAYREAGREPVTLYSVLGGGHTVPGATPAPAVLGRTGTDLHIDEIVGDLVVALTRSA